MAANEGEPKSFASTATPESVALKKKSPLLMQPRRQIEQLISMQLTSAAAQSSGTTVSNRLVEFWLRPWIYWLFHSYRLFGYFPMLPPAFYMFPRQTMLALSTYAAIHREPWWQKRVHSFLGIGASKKHKFVNRYKHLISDDKRYLFSLHPHGVLADGWHSLIARDEKSFADEGNGPEGIGRKISLCFAPIIQHVPVHQEMYRDKCGAADRKSIVKWWDTTTDVDPALIPGGFAESVFANSAETQYEYAYLKDRKGFIRICLEEGKDIVPIYTFRVNWMYRSTSVLRGWRSRFSQNYYIGLVPFFGKMGTSMPLTDETTTVVFPPFEVTRYEPDQLDECHAAYMEHLKTYFDLHKEEFGMKGVELRFVGGDFEDDDWMSKAATRLAPSIFAPRKPVATAKTKPSQRLNVLANQLTAPSVLPVPSAPEDRTSSVEVLSAL